MLNKLLLIEACCLFISGRYVNGADLFLCGNYIYNHYRDCKDENYFLSVCPSFNNLTFHRNSTTTTAFSFRSNDIQENMYFWRQLV